MARLQRAVEELCGMASVFCQRRMGESELPRGRRERKLPVTPGGMEWQRRLLSWARVLDKVSVRARKSERVPGVEGCGMRLGRRRAQVQQLELGKRGGSGWKECKGERGFIVLSPSVIVVGAVLLCSYHGVLSRLDALMFGVVHAWETGNWNQRQMEGRRQ